ncbi:MAG: calcium-binding protein [Caulobacteraceae bacterium]
MAKFVGTDNGEHLEGGAENDQINAKGGDDTIVSNLGADTIYGGSGNDYIQTAYRGSPMDDSDVDVVFSGAGDDTVFAGRGDVLDGGVGIDRLSFDFGIGFPFPGVEGGATQGVTLDLSGDLNIAMSEASGSSISGFERVFAIYGTGFRDRISLGESQARLFGGGGKDVLVGGAGDDSLRGGAGADRLSGDGGADILFGNAGSDTMDGGDGQDVLRYDQVDFGDADGPGIVIDVGAATVTQGGDIDRFKNIEVFLGTSSADRFKGGSGNDSFGSQGGRDTLSGGNGDDNLYSGTDDDRFSGGKGDDSISSGGGHDRIIYAAISDSIVGDGDHLFDLAEDDLIDISAIAQGQTFLIVDEMDGSARRISLSFDGDYTHILIDVDGGGADMEILAAGDVTDFTGFSFG